MEKKSDRTTEHFAPKLFYAAVDEVGDDAQFERLYDLLPLFRKEKADRIKTPDGKKLSILAGTLLCKGLSSYGIPADTVSIEKNEHGKEYLSYVNLFFNLSHSGSAAIALFSGSEIGCDIQKIGKKDDLKIAKRFFCREEYDHLKEIHDRDMNGFFDEFALVWSRKEAYVKALGKGLLLPFDSFNVLDGLHNVAGGPMAFREFDLIPGYKISCCLPYDTSVPEVIPYSKI